MANIAKEDKLKKEDVEYYGELALPLEEKMAFITNQIEQILESVDKDPESALVEHVKSRIKNANSLKTKLENLGYPIDAASGLSNLSDVLGLRIVTHFIGDIYSVFDMVNSNTNWKIVEVEDYIASPKENGYRSLHVVIALPFGYGGIEEIRAEIQMRTIAMDCWASLEHQLKYKKDLDNADLIIEELKRCADEMASTDLSLQTIRDLIKVKGLNRCK